MSALQFSSLKNSWEVFLLFSIPVGGGIPAGVVLAQSKGIDWTAMTILYFISDVCLAIVFEPIMMAIVWLSKKIPFLARLMENMKMVTNKTISGYGPNPGPFLLVMISFGVDPMVGRSTALAQGHNFISGWAVAIAGDMIFFFITMASTIWLNNILGDGTTTAIVIMVLMLGIPPIIRRFRKNKNAG